MPIMKCVCVCASLLQFVSNFLSRASARSARAWAWGVYLSPSCKRTEVTRRLELPRDALLSEDDHALPTYVWARLHRLGWSVRIALGRAFEGPPAVPSDVFGERGSVDEQAGHLLCRYRRWHRLNRPRVVRVASAEGLLLILHNVSRRAVLFPNMTLWIEYALTISSWRRLMKRTSAVYSAAIGDESEASTASVMGRRMISCSVCGVASGEGT